MFAAKPVVVALVVLAFVFGGSALVQGRWGTDKPGPSPNAKPHCVLEPGSEPTCPPCNFFDTHLCKCMKIPACKV